MIDKSVSKELGHRKAETLRDAEELAIWWQHNLLR
jgi:hypothetical protein